MGIYKNRFSLESRMRKIANNILLIYLLTCCYGCATVSPEVFNPHKKMEQLLLPLEIHILDPNIEEHYFSGKANIVSDDRIMEARYIVYKDFKKNIFKNSLLGLDIFIISFIKL